MGSLREVRRFTNIPDKAGTDGFEMVPDIGSDQTSETFPDGGSYSTPDILEPGDSGVEPFDLPERAKPQTMAEKALENWNQRESFKAVVYDQIGGKPEDFNEEKALRDFKDRGGYEGLFNHVFRGRLFWGDRDRMTPEQKQYWNEAVATQRAGLTEQIREKKKEIETKYKDLMGEFDKQVKTVDAETKARNKEAHAAILKEQSERTKALATEQKKRREEAEKKAKDKAEITLAEKKAFQAQVKDFDPINNVFSKYDKSIKRPDGGKGDWVTIPKTQLDIDIMNETAREAGEGIFVPIVRQREYPGEDKTFLGFKYGEGEPIMGPSDEFFRLPAMKDENIMEIVESAKKIRELSKEDPQAGKRIEDAFKEEMKFGMTVQGITELARLMKGGVPAQKTGDPLVEEFKTVQSSGDSSMKKEFQERINNLPEAERQAFLSKLKKKEPISRGSITVNEPAAQEEQPPDSTGTTAENLTVRKTERESREAKRNQRGFERRQRRAKSLQSAQ